MVVKQMITVHCMPIAFSLLQYAEMCAVSLLTLNVLGQEGRENTAVIETNSTLSCSPLPNLFSPRRVFCAALKELHSNQIKGSPSMPALLTAVQCAADSA